MGGLSRNMKRIFSDATITWLIQEALQGTSSPSGISVPRIKDPKASLRHQIQLRRPENACVLVPGAQRPTRDLQNLPKSKGTSAHLFTETVASSSVKFPLL